jgi:hypothetical protein
MNAAKSRKHYRKHPRKRRRKVDGAALPGK